MDHGRRKIICEFCGLEFSENKTGPRNKNLWRTHVYSKHLKNQVDEKIKSHTSCPVKNCDFELNSPDQKRIVQHYISGNHDVLEKLIENKFENNQKNPKEQDNSNDFDLLEKFKYDHEETKDETSEDTVSQNLQKNCIFTEFFFEIAILNFLK